MAGEQPDFGDLQIRAVAVGELDAWVRALDASFLLAVLGYASGRFALRAGHEGTGTVTSTGEDADLTLDVSALGALYLGDQTAHRLAAAGLVAEERAGALSRADRMLRTAAPPWCPDGF